MGGEDGAFKVTVLKGYSLKRDLDIRLERLIFVKDCSNPGLCGVQEHRDDAVPLCQSASTVPASSIHALPASISSGSGPFSTKELNAKFGAFLPRLAKEIDDLESSFLGGLRHYSAIRKARASLEQKQRIMAAIIQLNDDNNRFHFENPDVPPWGHNGARSEHINMDLYELYRIMGDLGMVAGSGSLESPGSEKASGILKNQQLSESDRDTLREYYKVDLYHDGKDHDPNSEYWNLHQRLNDVIAKIPQLDKPVTVWRGENYHPRHNRRDATKRTLERIQHIVNLQAGDTITWDQCAATTIDMSVATSGLFAHAVGERGEAIRLNFDDFDIDGKENLQHSVVFEMETDRGVFIDNDLHKVGHIDESEILLPMGMEYEVVGHAQVRASDMGEAHAEGSFHVIKLKLVGKRGRIQ